MGDGCITQWDGTDPLEKIGVKDVKDMEIEEIVEILVKTAEEYMHEESDTDRMVVEHQYDGNKGTQEFYNCLQRV